jgi:hypothetical protein
MDKQSNGYTAIQTEKGFQVVFHDSTKNPLEVTFNDFQEFANKYGQEIRAGKLPKLTEEEAILLSLWEMVLIPNGIKH